jgi:hypothetical protein
MNSSRIKATFTKTCTREQKQSKVNVTPRRAYAGINGRERYNYNLFLTSTLEGDKWSESGYGRFTTWEKPGTQYAGGWMGDGVCLQRHEQTHLHPESIPGHLAHSELLYRLSYPVPP